MASGILVSGIGQRQQQAQEDRQQPGQPLGRGPEELGPARPKRPLEAGEPGGDRPGHAGEGGPGDGAASEGGRQPEPLPAQGELERHEDQWQAEDGRKPRQVDRQHVRQRQSGDQQAIAAIAHALDQLAQREIRRRPRGKLGQDFPQPAAIAGMPRPHRCRRELSIAPPI